MSATPPPSEDSPAASALASGAAPAVAEDRKATKRRRRRERAAQRSRTFRVLHPRGPDKVEVWNWNFTDKAAPAHVKEALRISGMQCFGVAGTFEQADMDNWEQCTKTCHGVVSQRMALHTRMGLGHERFREELGARASDYRLSEINHRQFYRRWSDLMSGASWGEIAAREAAFVEANRG